MADSLVYKLQDIKEDRNTNLKPENLKAGVTCLGIEGTLEPNTGSDVEPIYVTSDYTVKTIPVDLNETIDSISTYEDYVVVHTTLNKLKAYNKSDLSTPFITKDNVIPYGQGCYYIYGFEDNKLYITNGFNGSSTQDYYIIDLSNTTITHATYTDPNRIRTSGDLNINMTNNIVHFKYGSYLSIYSYDITTGFTELFYQYNAVDSYIGNNVYQDSKNISIIQSNGSIVTSNVVPSNLNYDVCGLNYTKTKAFVYSYDDYKSVYIYSLNDDYSLNQLLGTVKLPFEFTDGTPIFQCLNSNYYYLSYKDNNYILNFDEETNQFSIVLTNENLIVRNSLPYIENENQYIDFEQGNVEIGITYNNKQYLTRDKYSGYTNTTLLSGHTMYDIAHEIVAGTMANNGDVVITPTTQEQTKDKGYYNSLKVNAVTSDIDANIKAENIKSGVEILGITGTLESGTGQVKLFETVEEMQLDNTSKEGDLAVVYRNEVQNMTVDTQTQYITFPETVVLPDAITSDYRCTYKYIDDTPGSFSVRLDNTSFSFSKRGTPRINITYTSVDGITYNRDEFTINTFEELTNPVDLDGVIHINLNTQWNDNFGYFMRIGGMTFKGLYNYGEIIHNDYIQLSPISSVSFDYENKEVSNINYTGEVIGEPISIEKVKSIYNSISEDIGDLDLSPQYEIFLNKSQELYLALGVNNHEVRYFYTTTDCQPLGFGESINSSLGMYVYRIDLENNSYELVDSVNGTGASAYSYIPYDDILTIPIMIRTSSTIPQIPTSWRIIDSSSTGATNLYLDDYIGAYPLYKSDEYQLAPTQLNATSEYVYEKEFYGKNGVETGTLGTPDNSFADTNAEIVYKIQNQYENMEPRVLTDDNKTIDKNMYFIPVKKDGTPLLDTSSVTTMEDMFNGCTNLTQIPLLNTSSAVNMQSMFMGCTNLQNISDLDTSKATNMSYMFHACTNLVTIPQLDTSKVTDIRSMFENCEHLMTVPDLNTSSATNMYSLFSGCASLTSIPLLDASNVTDVAYMFAACTNLVTIPQLDTSKVTNMMYMFMECTNLSDDSLNNVLAMCANATLYTGTKTLKYIGISEEQATKCTTLSNYEMFTSAGWTTGY